MRKPTRLECLYIDFDGFFASVMQQATPSLRGKPIGVIPMATDRPESTAIIACSKEAKALGVKNVMRVGEARAICKELILIPQRPDLFRRAHHALLNEIECEIPIDAVKSIDELACRLDKEAAQNPRALAARIKNRLRRNIGPYITASMGVAANRLLAKMACKIDKPDGVTIWRPQDMPNPLQMQQLSDIPGVGARMERRLARANIKNIKDLLNSEPKQIRALWSSVAGERLWYALQGYETHTPETRRGMFGHSRVLPPQARGLTEVRACLRLLLTKAARRMRREGFRASGLHISLDVMGRGGRWSGQAPLGAVRDDYSCLSAFAKIWDNFRRQAPPRTKILRCGATLFDLSPAHQAQGELLETSPQRGRWEAITDAIDQINQRHGKRVVTIGVWNPPGAFAGGKIAFTRIPSAEDFL